MMEINEIRPLFFRAYNEMRKLSEAGEEMDEEESTQESRNY